MSDDITELRLDEANELYFKISIHGAEKSPDAIRLVCENGDVSYSFKGKFTGEQDVVRFVVPALKKVIKSGQLCEARVEVIVDNHYFVPVKFNAEFVEPMNVVAEAVNPQTRKSIEQQQFVVEGTRVMPIKTGSASNTLKTKYVQKSEAPHETNNLPLGDALRKIVQEVVTEVRPSQQRSK